MKDRPEILIADDDLQAEFEEARRTWVQLDTLKNSFKLKCQKLAPKMDLTAANVAKLLELETHFKFDPRHEMTVSLRTYLEADEAA